MTAPAGPYTPTGLPDEPVGVFGCTVRQVGALVRRVEILDAPQGDRDPDVAITIAEVQTWITQLSDLLMARLGQFGRIGGDTRTRLLTAGADTVANGAASYVEAAGYPEQAAPADATSYAQVLWARWLHGAEAVAEAAASAIDAAGPDIAPDPRTAPAAWCFPEPALPDDKVW